MSHQPVRWLIPALLVAGATLAAAQVAPRTKPDPLDAGAGVPPVAYSSALAQYQRHAEQAVMSWREANETVNRIGGWRAYAREASQAAGNAPVAAPAQPASPAKPAAAPAAPAGHGGHKKH